MNTLEYLGVVAVAVVGSGLITLLVSRFFLACDQIEQIYKAVVKDDDKP